MFKLFLLIAVVAAAQAYKADAEKVKVLLYDDPDCYWCRVFVNEQLYPVHQEIGEIMDVEFNTFGFSYEPILGGAFINNRYVECCQKYVDDQAVFIEWDDCFMDDAHDGEGCATKAGISNWDTIKTCGDGDEGRDLLHEAGLREDAQVPAVEFYPWIAINGVGPNMDAQEDLKKEVCAAYTGTPPPAC